MSTIWVGVISYDNGQNVYVSPSEEGLIDQVFIYCQEQWNVPPETWDPEEETPITPIPIDKAEAVRDYFEWNGNIQSEEFIEFWDAVEYKDSRSKKLKSAFSQLKSIIRDLIGYANLDDDYIKMTYDTIDEIEEIIDGN